MSFIAAVLILNLDTADAFIAFSNLLNKPCQMAFFRVDHGLVSIPMCVWVPGCRVRTEQERPGPSVWQESSIFPSPGLLAASSTVQRGGLPGRCVDPEKWAANSHTCEFLSAFFQQVFLRINPWHERGGVPPAQTSSLCVRAGAWPGPPTWRSMGEAGAPQLFQHNTLVGASCFRTDPIGS